MTSWKTLAAHRRMNREDEGIQEISHDQALTGWNAHKLAAVRAQREPSLYFFPDLNAAQVVIERLGAEMGLDQKTIDLAIARLDVYANLCRNQEDGWEKTRRTRARHRQLAKDNPELWQLSEVLVSRCIGDHQARRADALEFGATTIDPSHAKVLN